MAEQQQDVDTLKRRGRRRLVGAVALVLLAVIVLPMVFDPEPRPVNPPVSVRIPGEDEAPFKPKPPAPKALEKKQAAVAPEKEAAPLSEKKQAARAPEKKDAERARAEAALSAGQFVIPVGAFANADAVVAKLAAAKIPYFTEAAQGNLTRVRAGPFATKEAADKALERMKGLGLRPGAVTTRG